MSTDFDQFWQHYPRKVAKGDARRAWEKAAKREPNLLALCLEALAWQRTQPQWTRDDGAYVPYPATWLNREQWADENPQIERERQRENRPKPAWYEQAMARAKAREAS